MRLSAAHLSRLQPEFAGNELGENTVDYAYVKERVRGEDHATEKSVFCELRLNGILTKIRGSGVDSLRQCDAPGA
jgi:hypothetical protein